MTSTLIQHEALIDKVVGENKKVIAAHKILTEEHKIEITYQGLITHIRRKKNKARQEKQRNEYHYQRLDANSIVAALVDQVNQQKNELKKLEIYQDTFLENLKQIMTVTYLGVMDCCPGTGSKKYSLNEFTKLGKLYIDLIKTYNETLMSPHSEGTEPEIVFNIEVLKEQKETTYVETCSQ